MRWLSHNQLPAGPGSRLLLPAAALLLVALAVHGASSETGKPGVEAAPPAAYFEAREKLNRGEYQAAADLFGQVAASTSGQNISADALYWRAFALYRLGTEPQLQEALQVLAEQRRLLPQLELAARRTLVQQRDARLARLEERTGGSQAELERLLQRQREETLAALQEQQATADPKQQEQNRKFMEEIDRIHSQTLAALRRHHLELQAQVDSQKAKLKSGFEQEDQQLRRQFAEKREQSQFLSQRILGSLAQRGDAGALRQLQAQARWPMPCSSPQIQAQESLRLGALAALSKIDPDTVRPTLSALIDPRNGCSKEVRSRAILLEGAYKDPQAAQSLRTVIRSGADPDLQLVALMALHDNPALPQMAGELVALYDMASEASVKRMLLSLYAQSRTQAATSKLIRIAREESDPELRARSISLLRRSEDPRARKAVENQTAMHGTGP